MVRDETGIVIREDRIYDLWRTLAAGLFNVPFEQVTPTQRQRAKRAGLRVLYKSRAGGSVDTTKPNYVAP